MENVSPIISERTTNPNYSNMSGLLLEVKFEGDDNWKKLKNSEPYHHNKPVSENRQLEQLEQYRDQWVSNGPKKYYTAQFRIGRYVHMGQGTYVFQKAVKSVETFK